LIVGHDFGGALVDVGASELGLCNAVGEVAHALLKGDIKALGKQAVPRPFLEGFQGR
jgi:hypothetical protein